MENLRGAKIFLEKFKGYEKFSLFSGKHSNRVSELKKDRPLTIGRVGAVPIISFESSRHTVRRKQTHIFWPRHCRYSDSQNFQFPTAAPTTPYSLGVGHMAPLSKIPKMVG